MRAKEKEKIWRTRFIEKGKENTEASRREEGGGKLILQAAET